MFPYCLYVNSQIKFSTRAPLGDFYSFRIFRLFPHILASNQAPAPLETFTKTEKYVILIFSEGNFQSNTFNTDHKNHGTVHFIDSQSPISWPPIWIGFLKTGIENLSAWISDSRQLTMSSRQTQPIIVTDAPDW